MDAHCLDTSLVRHTVRARTAGPCRVPPRQLLINAVTGHVGPGTQVTGNPTYQDLGISML